MLPEFHVAARRRPVDLIAPRMVRVDREFEPSSPAPRAESHPAGAVAPYLAVVVTLADVRPRTGTLTLTVSSGGNRLTGWYDGRRVGVRVTDPQGRSTGRPSRRHGRPAHPTALALVLTGAHLSVLSLEEGSWVGRGRVELTADTRDEDFLRGLEVGYSWSGPGDAPVRRLRVGSFGQLGLRDLHLVTTATGEPVRHEGRLLLTATHAGPGFFDTAHTGIWALDPASFDLEHLATLYFRRPDRPGVYGDHATHLVQDGDSWLVATSTWGDFGPPFENQRVRVTIGRLPELPLDGEHVVPTEVLALPSDRPGAWDPHLARIDGRWHVSYVTAARFFSFGPALAAGPSLSELHTVGEAEGRTATEGPVLTRIDGDWRLLASDGPDGPRRLRRRYPVFDLDLREVGTLAAPYLSNIPWPMVVRDTAHGRDRWLLLTFDGTRAGGALLGYGTHGDVVVMTTG